MPCFHVSGNTPEASSDGWGTVTACEINLEIAEEPGDGYLTLQTSQDFCAQSAIFSLRVITEIP